MSERTGIPVSTLSKIEHDRLTLTYDRLLQLSERLNMRLSDLFAEPESVSEPDRVTARRSAGRRCAKAIERMYFSSSRASRQAG